MKINKKPGLAVVISSPSGAGKTSICHTLINKHDDYTYSISATTRKKRGNEKDGVDYIFMTEDEFDEARKNNEFVESAKYINNWYATPKKPLENSIAAGKVVLLDIDIQGGRSIKKAIPDSVLIFILPPGLNELRERLNGRNTETDDIINKRVEAALKELKSWNEYDYAVVNDELEKAVAEVDTIIHAERNRTDRLFSKEYWNESLGKLLGLT